MAETSGPGSNCEDGCHFELCPHPPKGELSHDIELSDAFCRRQQELVSLRSVWRKSAAPWHARSDQNLRRLRRQMGQRAYPTARPWHTYTVNAMREERHELS